MKRRLLLTYLTLTAFVLVILEIPLGVTFARHERRVLAAEVERDAFVMASSSEDVLEGTGATDLGALVSAYQRRTGARVVIVDARGLAIADSAPSAPGERNFSTRPEIERALAGDVASGIRHSTTLGVDLLYVAVPVASGGTVHGAARITYPTSAVDGRIARNWLTLALVAVVVLLSALVVGWRFSSSVARPLRSLERTAVALAGGDLAARVTALRGPPEVRSVARTFNAMADRLAELVSSQRSFVADASHQLRTPLTALRLRLESIEEGSTTALRADAEAAAKEAWRLERIVDGLLMLARAEGTRPERTVEDVNAVVEARRTAWEPLATERSVTIRVQIEGAPAALCIPGGLEQILDNLLANALEVAPPGSAVGILAQRTPDWVELRVVDEGPGMSAEQRTHAFDRFWRSSTNGDGGFGLGLPIVRQIARASGGEAELDETPSGGVATIVRLPAG